MLEYRFVGTWRSQVSALVWGTRGRRFESARPDHPVHNPSDTATVRLHPDHQANLP